MVAADDRHVARRLRELLAWALREKLHLAATRIELSAPAAPPPRSCA
jgi:hypothetical protein